MRTILLLIGVAVISTGVSLGQKGTAEPDYYPQNYSGDTWTGVVTSANDDTREFTLTYKKKDKDETFTAVLPTSYKQKMADGTERAVKVAELMGVTLRAYYISKTKTENGQKARFNEVFKIKILALPKP